MSQLFQTTNLDLMQIDKSKIYKFIIFMGSITIIGPFAIDMYLPSMSKIAQDFQVTLADVQFSLTCYFLGAALGQFFYGPFIDRFGKRKPLLYGLILYFIGSLSCALATSNQFFVLSRILQALGGAAGVVVARVIVRENFEKSEAAKIFSFLMLMVGIAPIIAPSFGTLLTTFFSWRANFYFLAIMSFFVFIRSYRNIHDTKKELKAYEKKSFLHEMKSELIFFKEVVSDPSFIIPSLSGSLMQACLFAYITGSSYIFIVNYGIKESHYSLLFALNAIALIGSAQINARLINKFSVEKIFRSAISINLFFAILLIFALILKLNIFVFAILLALVLASVGFTFPNSTAMALSQTKHSGRASAILGTVQFTVASLASSLVNAFQNKTIYSMCAVMIFVSIVSNILFRQLKSHSA